MVPQVIDKARFAPGNGMASGSCDPKILGPGSRAPQKKVRWSWSPPWELPFIWIRLQPIDESRISEDFPLLRFPPAWIRLPLALLRLPPALKGGPGFAQTEAVKNLRSRRPFVSAAARPEPIGGGNNGDACIFPHCVRAIVNAAIASSGASMARIGRFVAAGQKLTMRRRSRGAGDARFSVLRVRM